MRLMLFPPLGLNQRQHRNTQKKSGKRDTQPDWYGCFLTAGHMFCRQSRHRTENSISARLLQKAASIFSTFKNPSHLFGNYFCSSANNYNNATNELQPQILQ